MNLEKLPDWLRDYTFDRYYSDNYVIVDFETTILDKGSPYEKENRVVCSSYKLGQGHSGYTGSTHFVKGNEYEQAQLVGCVESADFWVAHNTKFEYGWLERCGLPLEKTLAYCTQIGEYILRSNRTGLLSLDACLKRRGMESKTSLGSMLLKCGICPSEWPLSWLEKYSKMDVEVTERLFLRQRAELIRKDKLKTAFTRNIFTPVLVDIEKNGMHLDSERVKVLHRGYTHRLADIRTKIDIITGGANPASHPQMRKVLYEDLKFRVPTDAKFLTGSGEPTTSYDKYLHTLKPKNKRQERFLQLKREYGQVNAALTKALNKFNDCVSETTDHILTAQLNQCITKTQRLSSTGRNYKAQFQNFPRIFKPLFSARTEGWGIGEIDQAQLEYRVAVWYGQDEAGIRDIMGHVDSHAFTAEQIYGSVFSVLDAKDPVRKALRTDAKAHTFKPLYGGQSGSVNEVRYYRAFTEKHKGITHKQNEWKSEAIATQKVEAPNGITFYYPGTRITNTGYIVNTTNICNYPVQSLATADIVPIGVTYQWHLMKAENMKSFLINTVHDSSVAEVHPEEIELFKEIGELSGVSVVKEYLKKIYNIDFNVPLEVEVQLSKNWADTSDWRQLYLNNGESKE